MKFLAAALALLLVGFANSDMQLSYPEFIENKTHIYDVWINTTVGIPGMNSQVGKSAINLELGVYAKSKNEIFISIHKVKVSDSVASVGSKTDPIEMKTNKNLEQHLSLPFKASFEKGKVISYTLDNNESLYSKKIKETVLRHLQVNIDNDHMKSDGHPSRYPITFNYTRSSPVGNFMSHYIIQTSPYTDFPKDTNVINITRTDNYETIPYPAYHTHHNFEEQGCPGVCKKDHTENRYHAGCPAEWEPHQTLMKKSFVHHHNLRKLKTEDTVIIDIIRSKETHIADVYDQNMEVAIDTYIRFKHTSSTPIPEPTGQTTHDKLKDWHHESNDEEIERECKRTTSEEAIAIVKEVLNHVTEIVHEGKIEGEGKNIGEKLVLLQKALTLLKKEHLEKFHEDEISSYEEISKASEKEKIKRQLWLDNLPLIGSADSVSFIVDLIKKSANDKHHGIISLWEAKSMLEALPLNIFEPNGKTVQQLSELLEILQERTAPGYGLFYSATHIAVARTIRGLCSQVNRNPEGGEDRRQNYLQQLLRETDDDYKNSRCPKTEVKKFITDIAEKLKGNNDRLKRIVYIEALSQTGLKSAIQIMKPYAEGRFSAVTPSYRDFVKSVTILALHNVVGKYPKEVRDIVLPIYSNKTEAPKLRTAAFGVFIKSYPTLGDLQYVAEQNWVEPSQEVCSYVTSTLETLGNSTIPCDQLTARRIKKVMPQVKRCSNGKSHAQNIHRSIFDDIRGFGLEQHFEFTPSNESYIPSGIYVKYGYNVDSLKDIFFKYAVNSQGFNSENMYDSILRAMNLKPAENIPKSKEAHIFPEIEMADRATEFWRVTLFEKVFYSMSYIYLDDEEYQRGDIQSLMRQQLKNYCTWERNGKIHCSIIKEWMPSTYQSKANAQTLPAPIQFETRNPLLVSIKVDIDISEGEAKIKVHPTVYHSTMHSNQMLNPGDCKHVGVYHERKMEASYPFQLSFTVQEGKIGVSYKFPEFENHNMRKIFSYNSSSGTYSAKHNLREKESSIEKRPIETIPSMFTRNYTMGIIGLPSIETHVRTEDISYGYDEIPRNPEEAMRHFIRSYMNAGWRQKSVEIYRKIDSHLWGPKTEVKMTFNHEHKFVTPKEHVKPDDSWFNAINRDDDHDENDYSSQENDIDDKVRKVSHRYDALVISVEHKVNERKSNKALVSVVHNRTLEGDLHSWRLSANATASGTTLGVIVRGAAFYGNRPDEFIYKDDSYGKQRGLIVASINFPDSKKPYVAAKLTLSYKSPEEHLNEEVYPPITAEDVRPETHDQCLQDKKSGHALSVDCRKAIEEKAQYNSLRLKVIWSRPLPPVLEETCKKIELAYIVANPKHVQIEKKDSEPKSLEVKVDYIDKLTDHPVLDIVVRKPEEELRFHKVHPFVNTLVSSLYSIPESYIRHYTNNTYPATCTLSEKYVSTYDLKTIPLPKDKSCSYVLTSHCVRHKKFAVIVKIDSEKPKEKDIHIHVGQHEIVLTPPSGSKYEIKYDNRSYHAEYLHPIMLHEEEQIYVVVYRSENGHHVLEVISEKAGIKVTYDGHHVKTQVHHRYKGELCGLCSEFNGEIVMEMRGCNGCLYSHADDFTASNALGSCYSHKATHKSICNNRDYEHSGDDDDDDDVYDSKRKEYDPKDKRNHVLIEANRICYSIRPLNICKRDDVAIQTETKEIEFHCLPKDDKNARKLVPESRRRVLGELETKGVDKKEKVEYPTKCAKNN